ncbi:MAG: tRNA pseudouridine(38-40) synthase TruA [Chloroflexi bacterium]|nr:MAG: tRNA pseudouridine(38-40) synthase TruA [Chloroflexota bacterium]
MPRYRAIVEYDGTGYFGFQRQRDDQPTVQSRLEDVLTGLAGGEPVRVTGAGRTDSGVHALGQVICFELTWRHREEDLLRAMNANLPDDIAIKALIECSETFHPRFDARRRAYEYHVYNAAVRSPIRRLRSWHVARSLDVERMNEAAACLIGVHDFATFGQPPQGENSVREVFVAEWRREGEMLVFFIEANAFLYRMVRSIVGSLKLVGEGSWTVADFEEAFRACDRARCGTVAPPHGLYLVSVCYED